MHRAAQVSHAVTSIQRIEAIVRRDKFVTAAALGILTVLAWAYLVRMEREMSAAASEAEMHAAMGMAGMDATAWGFSELSALFIMWAVMMAGMMLPSAAPVILLTAGVYRRRGGEQAGRSTAAFVSGYLVAWTVFSALAALTQAGLHSAALMSASMASKSAWLAGALFVVAGLYQWLPLKNACLTHCRSPLQFLTEEWREGTRGAFVMGLRHGVFCVGCCWGLMLLLFATGVMNLAWVAAIAAFVLVEKLLPHGLRIGRYAGVLLIAWGLWVFITGV